MPKMVRITHNQIGFSLVEILVTISLVSMIAAVSIPNLRQYNSDLGLENTVSDINQVLKIAQSHAQSSIICDNGGVALSWNVEFKPQDYSFHGNCSGNYKDIRINSRAFNTDGSTAMVSNNCNDSNFTVEFSKTDVNATCASGEKVSNTLAVTLKDNKDTTLLADINISKGGLIFPGYRKQNPNATPFPSLNPTPTPIPTASPTPSPTPVSTASPSPTPSPTPALQTNITLDSKTTFTVLPNGSSMSYSWNHTVGNGTNRQLIVQVSYREATNAISSVTYGSQALSNLHTFSINGMKVEVWKLASPNIGTNSVTTSFIRAPANKTGLMAASSSWFGVNQTTPNGTPVTNYGTGTTISVIVPSSAGDYVIDTINQDSTTVSTIGSGQTQIYNAVQGSGAGLSGGAGSFEAGAPSVTMSWVTPRANWANIGFSLKPAASGGGPPPVDPFGPY